MVREGVLAELEIAAGPAVCLDPDSGLGLEVVLAVLIVAAGPDVDLDPTRGLVVLEAVLAELKVAAGPAVGLDPACSLGLDVVLAVLVVAAGPAVGLDPTRGLGLSRQLVLVELEVVLADLVVLARYRGQSFLSPRPVSAWYKAKHLAWYRRMGFLSLSAWRLA